MASEDDFHAIDEFLLSLQNEEAMTLSEFDGFCAGLVVCPEMIRPSEWIPQVWVAGGAPDFETFGDHQNAVDVLIGHYAQVERSLMPTANDYGPLFDRDPDTDEIIWDMWIFGFEQAMRLRPNAWEEVSASDDKKAVSSVSLALTLHSIAAGQEDLPRKQADKLSAEAPDLVVSIVLALNDWGKGHRPSDTENPLWPPSEFDAPFRGTKVGRNAPCPCDSGRKYKLCCGAN